MVAVNRRRIHCVVVAVPAEADLFAERGALAHELVPGADPYVAQLIARLQDEVIGRYGWISFAPGNAKYYLPPVDTTRHEET